jgi:hypothetical protein
MNNEQWIIKEVLPPNVRRTLILFDLLKIVVIYVVYSTLLNIKGILGLWNFS